MAFKITKLAADQGFTPAQKEISSMYVQGRGVKTNYIQALYWFIRYAYTEFPKYVYFWCLQDAYRYSPDAFSSKRSNFSM